MARRRSKYAGRELPKVSNPVEALRRFAVVEAAGTEDSLRRDAESEIMREQYNPKQNLQDWRVFVDEVAEAYVKNKRWDKEFTIADFLFPSKIRDAAAKELINDFWSDIASEYPDMKFPKVASMSKKAGYTHYWKRLNDSGFTSAQWSSLLREADKIIKAAEKVGISIKGPHGSGNPKLTNQHIALNGDASVKEDHESFVLTRQLYYGLNNPFLESDWCKTNNKPYDAVVVSILAAAQKIAPDVIEVSSDGGSSAIKRVLASQNIDGIQAEFEEKVARFEKGVSVDVPQYLREHRNPDAAEEWEEMNEKYRDKFKTATQKRLLKKARISDDAEELRMWIDNEEGLYRRAENIRQEALDIMVEGSYDRWDHNRIVEDWEELVRETAKVIERVVPDSDYVPFNKRSIKEAAEECAREFLVDVQKGRIRGSDYGYSNAEMKAIPKEVMKLRV